MSSSSGAYVLSTGAEYGNTYTTEEMLEAFHKQRAAVGDKTYDADFADRVFRACGFDGHSVALPKEDLFRTMTREEYLEHRATNMVTMAQKACETALAQWGGDRSEITHLFWGTMTGGLKSPTIDILLTQRLGLSLDVERTSIEGMGCLTGFRLLNLARAEAQANPKSRVLVIEADLRSALGNSLPDSVERADIVSASLFRDAASAAVVGGAELRRGDVARYEIVHGASRIVKDSLDLVQYQEYNGGEIRLLLSKELPAAIGREESSFVRDMVAGAVDLCQERGRTVPPVSISDFDVLCHTGGPRVLKEVAESLGVTDKHLASSWAIMRSKGNLSVASNLTVLNHHNTYGDENTRQWVLCLSMGPGACLEGVVLQRFSATASSPMPLMKSVSPLKPSKALDLATDSAYSDGVVLQPFSSTRLSPMPLMESVAPLNPSRALILATGSAYGKIYKTEEMLEAFHKQRAAVGDKTYDADFADRVFRACGFDGHSVALPKEDLFRTMTREEYLEHRATNMVTMAQKACEMALAQWGGDRSEITHLFWGTMTGGLKSPTIDILLTQLLGLSLDVERTSIEGMGCLTGFRLLNLARAEVQVNPKSRVLVIEADLRSALGNSLPDSVERADIVSASLFRDAASAAVVGGAELRQVEVARYEIVHGASRIVKDSLDLVQYQEYNGGKIRLLLSKELPAAIGREEPSFVRDMVAGAVDLCQERGRTVPPVSIADFDVLCHTGGPRVLKEVAESLGVTDEHLASSWAIMRSKGNLSGASNLAVLNHHNTYGDENTRQWVLCLSMGPGACLEGSVLRRVSPVSKPTPSPPSCPKVVSTISVKERRSLVTAPLGDPGVEVMVRRTIQRKIEEQHVSTDYPKMWITREATFVEQVRQCLKYTIPLLFGALLVLDCFSWSDRGSDASVCVLLTATIVSSMVAVVSSIQLDNATRLSFLGVSTMLLGSIVNVSVGPAVVGADESSVTRVGTTVGFSLLAFGVQIFSYTSFVFLAWQFMIGSVLLSVGLLLRACAALIRANNEENVDTTATNVDIAAIPIFFIALVLMGARSYFNMRKPWLCPPNFVFYGTVLFGFGEVLGGSILAINPKFHDEDGNGLSLPDWHMVIDSLTRGAMLVATVLLTLDSAITSFHLERTVEYSYPAMTMLVFSTQGIALCRMAATFVILVAALGYVWHCLDTTDDTAPNGLDAALSLVLAVTSVSLAVLSCSTGHLSTTFKPFSQTAGLALLGAAYTLRALWKGELDAVSATALRVASTAVGICGALVLVALALKLPMAQWRVQPWMPHTYVRALHPGNYFLLANVLVALCFMLWLFEEETAAYLTLLVAGLLIQFYLSMTLHVHKITHPRHRGQPKMQGSRTLTKNMETFHSEGDDSTSNFLVQTCAVPVEDTKNVDVLIVGAGPTGLLTASILGQHGVSVMLIELRPEPVEDARFTVINSASMELLAKVLDPDIFAELRTRAMPDSTPYGSMLVSGLGHADAKVIETANSPSRKRLMEDLGTICDTTESRILGSKHASELPIRANQSHQEEVLKKQAERHKSVQVLYGHRLLDFNIVNGDSVVARVCPCTSDHLADADPSQVFVVHSRYIIGTDGPRSTVAQGLGIHFDGFLNAGRTRSLLVRAPGLYEDVLSRLGGTFMYQVLRAKYGLCAIVAADPKKELWNFLMIIGAKTQNASTDEICKEFLGTTNYLAVQDRNWYWNFFIAREWRNGPGFLAGDAAHSWPPFGALGGNSGYGDAVNLGWKLAAVCKGLGGEALLDSYTIERRQQAIQTALFVLSLTPRPQLVNKYVIPYANSPIMRIWIRNYWYYSNSGKHIGNHFCQSGIQLGTKYNHSPIVTFEHPLPDDPFCDYLPCVRGGARLPFFHVPSPEDASVLVGVHDLVANMGYTAFILSQCEPAKVAVQALQQDFAEVGMPFCVREINIARLEKEQANNGTRAQALEIWKEELVILVRPDNIVAWHLPVSSVEEEPNKDWTDTCRAVVATVTALSPADGTAFTHSSSRSDQLIQMENYQAWLTKQFRFNLRPYKFIFPGSVSVHNETKEEAVDKMRTKKEGQKFDVTTKNKAIPHTSAAVP